MLVYLLNNKAGKLRRTFLSSLNVSGATSLSGNTTCNSLLNVKGTITTEGLYVADSYYILINIKWQ